jgi:hypothetical protein
LKTFNIFFPPLSSFSAHRSCSIKNYLGLLATTFLLTPTSSFFCRHVVILPNLLDSALHLDFNVSYSSKSSSILAAATGLITTASAHGFITSHKHTWQDQQWKQPAAPRPPTMQPTYKSGQLDRLWALHSMLELRIPSMRMCGL